MIVKLTDEEWRTAIDVGIARQVRSVKAGRTPGHGYDRGKDWSDNIEGAAGELAVAKAFGFYWGGSVDTFKTIPDVAGLEVRTTTRPNGRLIVRPDDPDGRAFILVTGPSPRLVLRGWILGSEAKLRQWREAPGGRPEAWFVPQDKLWPLEELFPRRDQEEAILA